MTVLMIFFENYDLLYVCTNIKYGYSLGKIKLENLV